MDFASLDRRIINFENLLTIIHLAFDFFRTFDVIPDGAQEHFTTFENDTIVIVIIAQHSVADYTGATRLVSTKSARF